MITQNGRYESLFNFLLENRSFLDQIVQNNFANVILDWFKMNPKYNSNLAVNTSNGNDLSVFSKPLTSSFMAKELHDETITMFLQAARQNHLGVYLLF